MTLILYAAEYRNVQATSFEITCSTTIGGGELRWTVDRSTGDTPTPQQVYDGLNAKGEPAQLTGNAPITTEGQQPWRGISGAEPSVTYYSWFVQEYTGPDAVTWGGDTVTFGGEEVTF